MKLPGLSVLPKTAIIINPIGDVRALLNFCHQDPFANSMQRSGWDKIHISLLDRNRPHLFHQGIFPDRLFQFFPAAGFL